MIDVVKLKHIISRVGCRASLLNAKNMTYDLADDCNIKNIILYTYRVYNELSDKELTYSKVISFLEDVINSLKSSEVKHKLIAYLYPTIKYYGLFPTAPKTS